MQIQTLQQKDLPLIPGILPPGWEASILTLDYYFKSDQCFPIKLLVDGSLAGIGAAIIHKEVAWLAHIIVHPDFRNRGFGEKITRALVDIATSKECETIYLLATDLGEPVYKKVGFESETEYLVFKGRLPESTMHLPGNVTTFEDRFREEVSKMDRKVSGEERMFELEEHLAAAFVYLENNKVSGYYLPTLGDGLIIATTETAGLELVKIRLRTKEFAIFPLENLCVAEYLRANNFPLQETQKRMRNWAGKEAGNRQISIIGLAETKAKNPHLHNFPNLTNPLTH